MSIDETNAAPELEDLSPGEPPTKIEDAARRRAEKQAAQDGQKWDEPMPFGERTVPEFPFALLPDSLRALSESVSENVDACPDLVACAGLGVAATLTTGRVSVRMSDSWKTPVALYTVMLATSGHGKGPAFEFTTDPLVAAEKDLRETNRDRVERERTAYDIAEARAKDLTSKAAKASGDGAVNLEREAAEAGVQFGRMIRPDVACYSINDDFTEAALAGALVANNQRLGIISPEARTLFDTIAGRHSKQGSPEARIILAGWSGEQAKQIRVERGQTDLTHPQLSITVSLQPDTFDSFVRRPELADVGLFNRFLISRPAWSNNPDELPTFEIPKMVRERWAMLVQDLTRIPDQGHHGWLLNFTPEAREAFRAMQLRSRQMNKPGGLFAPFPEYETKFSTNLARLAGLLHCMELAEHGESREGYDRKPIELATIERLDGIADYFARHAAASFGAAGMDEREQKAAKILRRCREWVREGGKGLHADSDGRRFIDVRTLSRDLCGASRTMKGAPDVLDGCQLLVEREWLRDAPQPVTRPGPAGTWFELHPTAFND